MGPGTMKLPMAWKMGKAVVGSGASRLLVTFDPFGV